MFPFADEDLTPQCSRAQCDESAVTAIQWRNPKIHDASRTKTWLACDEHRQYLTEFLRARNFPVEVVPYDAVRRQNVDPDDQP